VQTKLEPWGIPRLSAPKTNLPANEKREAQVYFPFAP
jgi:hypothetical protein